MFQLAFQVTSRDSLHYFEAMFTIYCAHLWFVSFWQKRIIIIIIILSALDHVGCKVGNAAHLLKTTKQTRKCLNGTTLFFKLR